MINKKKATILVIVLVVAAVAAITIMFKGQAAGQGVQAQPAQPAAPAQNPEPRPQPAIVGQPMADFTLPVYQGGTLTLSSLRGQNVLILFPRGYAAENYWCTICNYYYAELVELEKAKAFRKGYNLEVLIVLPYARETVKAWVDDMPAQLEKLHGWKFPAEPDKLDERGKARMERMRTALPLDVLFKKGEVPTPFPILIDADRAVTGSLGIFTMEWGGSKIAQNIPTVMLVDAEGTLRFKYMGQNTWDRPGYDYLFKQMDGLGWRK